ncbi:MAG: helicase [Cressdnaviricota sp.]|nr:MAG: helicase [Cressdnaviricota sp.]
MVNFAQARHWTFTVHFEKRPIYIQEATEREQDEWISRVSKRTDYRYLIAGKEMGEQESPHLQCYIIWKTPKRFETTKKILSGPKGVRLAQSSGSAKDNKKYCSKEDNWVEFGTIPIESSEAGRLGGKGKAKADAELLRRAQDGDFEWIKTNYPGRWIKDSAKLLSLYERKAEILQGDILPHEWWVGPTGCGKSRLMWELYPNHYDKDLNKWWDGYFNEDVVIIEEWCPKNDVTGSRLKKWGDRNPFNAEIKGGVLKMIRPKKVIVLSNYTMEQCFLNQEDLLPMKRRFKEINWGTNKIQQEATKAKIKEYADQFYNGLLKEEEESSAVLESESQTIASPDSEEPVWMNWDWGQLDVDMPNLLEEL